MAGRSSSGDVRPLKERVQVVVEAVRACAAPIQAYQLLMNLCATDRDLAYASLIQHTQELTPYVYTPVVGQACLEYSRMLIPRAGLYLTKHDAGRMKEKLAAFAPAGSVAACVITDGGRILGLGDLGANGMGIPVGKLALYTALAGCDPAKLLPVTLDVGTDNEKLLADPLYLGLRERRLRDTEAYDRLIEEFVAAMKSLYGENVLIQWEDFDSSNAFRVLHKYAPEACTFNDDIQGTASVILSGCVTAAQVAGIPLSDMTFLFYGAGEAGVGIADLLAYTMALETLHKPSVEASTPRSGRREAFAAPRADQAAEFEAALAAARSRIWLVDSKGLVVASRKAEKGFAHHKLNYAHEGMAPIAELADIIPAVKPHALIGVSAQPQTFTQAVVEAMCAVTPRPLIFALSNPTSKSECTAEQAITWSKGACIFASGSPFDAVTYEGKTIVPGQGNNSYIFGAVGLACMACAIKRVDDHTMFTAALALSECVAEADLAKGCIYPSWDRIREVSAWIATAVAEDAYARGLATLARPADLAAHIKANMWLPKDAAAAPAAAAGGAGGH